MLRMKERRKEREREEERYFRRSHKYLGGNIFGLLSCERSSRQSSGQSIWRSAYSLRWTINTCDYNMRRTRDNWCERYLRNPHLYFIILLFISDYFLPMKNIAKHEILSSIKNIEILSESQTMNVIRHNRSIISLLDNGWDCHESCRSVTPALLYLHLSRHTLFKPSKKIKQYYRLELHVFRSYSSYSVSSRVSYIT